MYCTVLTLCLCNLLGQNNIGTANNMRQAVGGMACAYACSGLTFLTRHCSCGGKALHKGAGPPSTKSHAVTTHDLATLYKRNCGTCFECCTLCDPQAAERSLSELKEFAAQLKALPHIQRHIGLAEAVNRAIAAPAFRARVAIEQQLLDGHGIDAAAEAIDVCAHRRAPGCALH